MEVVDEIEPWAHNLAGASIIILGKFINIIQLII
jgi:hypothetical protein